MFTQFLYICIFLSMKTRAVQDCLQFFPPPPPPQKSEMLVAFSGKIQMGNGGNMTANPRSVLEERSRERPFVHPSEPRAGATGR